MSILEFVTFTASATFLTNPDTPSEGMALIVKSKGCRSAFYGLQSEDEKIGYFVIAWDTREDHEASKQSPGHAAAVKTLNRAVDLTQPVGSHLVTIKDVATGIILALESKSTEIVVGSVKAGNTLEVALGRFDDLAGQIETVLVGESIENPHVFVAFLGWDNVQAHVEKVSPEKFYEKVESLQEVADLTLKHVSLSKVA